MPAIPGFVPPYLIHVGCNQHKIQGWVNVDTRRTEATDLVHDCKDLAPFDNETAIAIFANAFIEHLKRLDCIPFLKETHRVLKSDGFLHLSGLPDFEAVARAYLEKKPGHVSPRFDLFEVYRYTHGDPEHQPDWWMEQLHKNIFDVTTLKQLLTQAGFKKLFLYRYPYGPEANPINLGCFAWKTDQGLSEEKLHSFVSDFSKLTNANLEKTTFGL